MERLHEVWLPWKVNKKRVAPRATPIQFNGSLPHKITELTSLAGALFTLLPTVNNR